MRELGKILLVEDNERFAAAARGYFVDSLGAKPEMLCEARDYDSALAALRESYPEKFSGAVIDCFFPSRQGSDSRALGERAIELMRTAVPSRRTGPVTAALTKVGDILGRDIAKIIAKNAYADYGQYVDNYKALEWALKESEHNQALGVIVAEDAERRGIPFVLTTSTNHHDELTQPITDYCGVRGWKLVDCGKDRQEDKAMPEFWERVFEQLLHIRE